MLRPVLTRISFVMVRLWHHHQRCRPASRLQQYQRAFRVPERAQIDYQVAHVYRHSCNRGSKRFSWLANTSMSFGSAASK